MLPVYGWPIVGRFNVPPLSRGRGSTRSRASRFSATRIRPADPADPPLTFVSCGRPIPGHDVRMVDESGRRLGPRASRGASSSAALRTAGLLPESGGHPTAFPGLARLRRPRVLGGQRALRHGPAKDLIIRGRPQHLAAGTGEVAGRSPAYAGCVAAFGVPDPAIGTERVRGRRIRERRTRRPGGPCPRRRPASPTAGFHGSSSSPRPAPCSRPRAGRSGGARPGRRTSRATRAPTRGREAMGGAEWRRRRWRRGAAWRGRALCLAYTGIRVPSCCS